MRVEKRSVEAVVSHYRRIIRKMSPNRRIEYLLQLVGTRTAIARTEHAAYERLRLWTFTSKKSRIAR